ncbi:hypothetical protein XFF6166_80069 [Xanthomonas citri pv. fuscans]|nr:hypothetical protein XFF6166_80069 [Xanthomonas citri pv. fuscans]SON99771.1 hypothetical protein XFF6960_200045 [Xanthomonas citri pv. fuscans]SOO03186.1 hypothetical protein XFF7767_150068 [Xanthomonas citri pv. fuscans]SOO09261.1 hypothetical protein XFF6970_330043 [Xanthomonas citri pv. fuscans]SOO15643.1 hypothetical protein XFF7766_600068 [Xanthomonas citri pv. fuscans]
MPDLRRASQLAEVGMGTAVYARRLMHVSVRAHAPRVASR